MGAVPDRSNDRDAVKAVMRDDMLYSMKLKETTAAAPRVVDASRVATPASVKSGEGLRCGRRRRWARYPGGDPSLKLAAVAYGVSIGSVARALKLTPEQRDAVRQGKRALLHVLRR